jgi:amidase
VPSLAEELRWQDAVEQAERVRRRELHAVELVEAAIERIERANPRLNAVIARFYERACQAARTRRGARPLGGVPFLLKDLGAVEAGQPYFAGNRALRDADHRASADTPLGRRLRRTGLIALGKTNTPEFGLQSTTQPLAFGPTRNPFALDRSPGGSSGGSCAAVAAGLVPIAHGNDGGGSIRIPAAWCGLVGLKPSRARMPREAGGAVAATEFAVCRSVRDAAALLDALGPRARAPRLADAIREAAEGLRVALLAAAPGVRVHADCAEAVDCTGRVLESLGHRLEWAQPASLFEEERAWRGLAAGTIEFRSALVELERRLGRAVGPDDVEPFLWSVAHLDVRPVSDAEHRAHALAERRWIRRVRRFWHRFDLLVTPTVHEPPPRLAELEPPAEQPWRLLDRIAPHMTFTEPWNATGQPAISLPLHATREGLPIGVQLVAAPGRDDLLLRVASSLERACPWRDRTPPDRGHAS